jgi:hypothetical protein
LFMRGNTRGSLEYADALQGARSASKNARPVLRTQAYIACLDEGNNVETIVDSSLSADI